MKKFVVALGVLAVIVVAAVLLWPRGGTKVEKEQAVTDFRAESRDAPKREQGKQNGSDEAVETGSALPAPGVYSFASSGQEEVKLGPFPADTRIFPDEIVASVTDATTKESKDCFDFELKLLAEHTEKTTYCLVSSGGGDSDARSGGATPHLVVAAHTKQLKMGPAAPTATLVCDPRITITPGADEQAASCKLTLGGGPVEVNADMASTFEVGPVGPVEVAGEEVSAFPVRITYNATGSVTGVWSEVIWMSAEDWLPVRIERDVALSGPASITESSDLQLKSLKPAT